jgi:uncharacterized membrane protein YdbT with pleckstrin-like domain
MTICIHRRLLTREIMEEKTNQLSDISYQQSEAAPKAWVKRLGLGRKSNVAIAAIAGLAAVQQSKAAVIAIVIITLVSITYQAVLDWFDKDDEY